MTIQTKIWEIVREACLKAWQMGNINDENEKKANKIVDEATKTILKIKEVN